MQAFKVGYVENLVEPSGGEIPLSNQVQEVLSVDPFSAQVAYRYEGDSLTMAIDDDLPDVEVTE